ncbi:MAG: sigma-70 family RNA polymerase sigma factor [Ignavibacteriae bacterium]|nr:sigma-70 family RNA polymerase sigma factor [Ignavibacteriota bacterium]
MANPDYETIQRILAGEKRAYAELIDRHKDRAMTLALRMLKNREDAEEALQDAFVRAFNALSRFEWKSSFFTWFYRIVYNVCATVLSRRGDESFSSVDDDEGVTGELPSLDKLPDTDYEGLEFRRIVQREIDRLPPVYASVLTLFLIQDLSYDEIVEATGLPLGTVKVRLFRARGMLRDAVIGALDEGSQQSSQRKVALKP